MHSFDRAAAPLFVFLWSTGWIVAKLGGIVTGPLTFLSMRLGTAALVLGLACLIFSWRLPSTPKPIFHAIASGVLLHGFHLGGVWWAIAHGVPAGLSGIIAALQPLLSALLAQMVLNERLSRLQAVGLILGFAGVAIAISPKLIEADGSSLPILAIGVNAAAMLSVTCGTLYQKRYLGSGDLRGIAALQFVGGLLVTLSAAFLLESRPVPFNPESLALLTWAVLGNSIAGILLWLHLIRQGTVATAMSLMYLMPPMVALEAAIVFGERLTGLMIIGSAIAVLGVYLTNRAAAEPHPPSQR